MDLVLGDAQDASPTMFSISTAHNEDRLIRYPSKVNVFRSIRANLKLSHQDVANQTGLSRLYVIRAEQGVYPHPADRLVRWAVSKVATPDEDYVRYEYRQYQKRCRQENGPVTNHSLLTENDDLFTLLRDTDNPVFHSTGRPRIGTSPEHPFRLWLRDGRYSLSVMQACKGFCISPTLLQRFVAEPYRVHTVPVPVRDALLEAGYKVRLLDGLEEAYKVYRKRLYRSDDASNKQSNESEKEKEELDGAS